MDELRLRFIQQQEIGDGYAHIFAEAALCHKILDRAVALERQAVFSHDGIQDSVSASLMLGAQMQSSGTYTLVGWIQLGPRCVLCSPSQSELPWFKFLIHDLRAFQYQSVPELHCDSLQLLLSPPSETLLPWHKVYL
ncbi:Hypothetical protein SMAX5B_000941 [Scophthalmus maximus]|uniref:Uncharacterized protein n=1 Tax=Scophthalmus maximus TaxID=52904 RepID=A0A2U9C4N2_SCOMX|nr:Hypothetical protein SMAX5B_000941 [Scophthalmus maximus]